MGFEELGKKLMRLGQDTKTGVQKMGETYQINSKISDEKKTINKIYQTIGEKIYELHADAPLEGLEEEFEAIKTAQENIKTFTEQLQQSKGVVLCPECGKQAAKDEKFCSACGAKIPDLTDAEADLKADLKDAAGEMADTANELINNVAEKAKAFAKGVTSKMPAEDNPETADADKSESDEPETVEPEAVEAAAAESETEEPAPAETAADPAEPAEAAQAEAEAETPKTEDSAQ